MRCREKSRADFLHGFDLLHCENVEHDRPSRFHWHNLTRLLSKESTRVRQVQRADSMGPEGEILGQGRQHLRSAAVLY